MYSTDELENPVSGSGGMSVPLAAAVVVIGSLVLLIAIKHGFRGVHGLGVSVAVK